MARFLRLIFNLLLVCYIAAALALFVPPLVGVSTAVTMEDTTGNQEVGSVNYAWRTPLRSLQTGDEMLVTADQAVNVYTIQNVDTENSVITTADGQELSVRTYVYKLMLTIPYLGYIAIAMQTVEGMIILGASAAVLILLCILTRIWCKKRKIKRMQEEEDELDDEEENEFFQKLADEKRENTAREEAEFLSRRSGEEEASAVQEIQPALDEEYDEYEDFPAFEESAEQSAGEEAVEETADESAGEAESEEVAADAVAEIAADTDAQESSEQGAALEAVPADPEAEAEVQETAENLQEAEETVSEDPRETDETAPEEAVEEKEPEAELVETEEEMAVEHAVETGNIPGVQAALEAALNTQQIQRHVRRVEPVREPEEDADALAAEEIELAMPVHTLDEFLETAYANGEDPLVRKDELTGVTYVDYSECL